MKHIPIFVFSVVLAGVTVLFAISLLAQETPSGDKAALIRGDTTPELTLAEVEAALAAIEADSRIKDAEKDLLRPKYKQAIEALKQAADFATQTAGYREAIKTAPEKTAELRAQLEILPPAESTIEVIPTGSTKDFQKDIVSRRAALSDLNDDLSKIRSELARVEKRPFEISIRRPEAQGEMSDIRKQLASPIFAEDEISPDRVAERIVLQAAQLKLLDESAMLEQEQLSQSVREDLLQAQYELLKRRVEIDEAALVALERLLQQRLTSEATRVGSLAESMPEGVPEGDEAAQALAVEVQALAEEFEDVVLKLKNLKTAQDNIVSKLGDLNERYEVVREGLEVGGGGRGMAQVLLDIRRQFPDHLAYVKGLTTQVAPLEETRLAAFQIRAKLRRQAEVEKQFSNHPSETVATLVTTRREVLEQLYTQYGNLARGLAALEGDKRRYLDKATEVRAYAAEQLFGFGMRSAPPISVETFSDVPDGIQWFFRGDHWTGLGRNLQGMATRMPVLSMGIVFVVVVLLLVRRRLGAALEQTTAKVRRASTDSYAYTSQALLWTTLLAVPIPLLIGYTAWALQQTPESSAWIRGMANGLQRATWIAFVLAFLSTVCRPGGLGAIHFRWPEKPLVRFRRAINCFAVVYIPALLITYSGAYEETSNYFFSVGRFSFMLALVGMVIVLWQGFDLSAGILARFMSEHPAYLIARWRYLWFPLMLTIPLALVVIAGLGYMFTALKLNLGLLESAAVIAGGVILYWLTRRWFRVKQRKLALAEALERRRARQEAEVPQGQQSGDIVTIDPEDEEKQDLVSIDEQTRDLLRLLFSLGVAVAILFRWSDSFPVFATFDAIPIPLVRGLTLLGLVRAILIVVVTYIAVRKLPGLLELAVLRATSIDAGTRNAISTLCQYALIAIGLALLFNVLQVNWAKLGWIAAALSVGIGFGLQEVVANFVCGLIVLFERPIRVGDFVTVDGVTGTVSKIRIRATTIINGDRQDFVVPNKRLITGSLLNWTLSAGLNRVIIRLGVARGSDTDKARQILLDVAADHPLVLDEPMPIATFEQFGDSSLNLVLYAYLPNLDNRTNTISELHTEIDKRFAAAGYR